MRNIVFVMLGLTAAGAGCSSAKSGATGPSGSPAATITITTTGVSQKSVTVPRGSQVQFTNNDRISHQVSSDPHPEHTDCPEINSVGFITTNQSRQTSNLNIARTCGFHDHNRPDDKSLQGSIVIQ